MESSRSIKHLTFTSPDVLEAALQQAAKGAKIGPVKGTALRGRAKVAGLSKIQFLSLETEPLFAQIEPAHHFYGLTITRGVPFHIMNGSEKETFDQGCAHLLSPGEPFDFRSTQGTSVYGTNFYVDNLEDYACRLNGDGDTFRLPEDRRISLKTAAGASFMRYLSFVWGELACPGGVLNSRLAAAEIEDGLIAALTHAIDGTMNDFVPAGLNHKDPAISRAEDYILAHLSDPVSRADLAQISGSSIRTLSRAFWRRHGMGPMAFLKRSRLEAARRELTDAEPGEINVSDVALRFGFSQPGKFSAAYKTLFNENPSRTLLRF
jgi:AraC-like DNA-binding protein